MEKCPKCGSTDIIPGEMVSAGSCAFKSDRHKLIFKSNSLAWACFECGYIESYVSREYLDRVRQEEAQSG